MRATGLRLSQYSVLSNLSDEPQSLLQLAARLEMDRTTLTRSCSTPSRPRSFLPATSADAALPGSICSKNQILFCP